jgi:hypothetical protein
MYEAATDFSLRRGLEQFADPLEREGVDELAVGSSVPATVGSWEVRIRKSDRSAIEAATLTPGADVLPPHIESFERRDLTIVSATFDPALMWRFEFGRERFLANIEDAAFLERVVQRRVEFGRGPAAVRLRHHVQRRRAGATNRRRPQGARAHTAAAAQHAVRRRRRLIHNRRC